MCSSTGGTEPKGQPARGTSRGIILWHMGSSIDLCAEFRRLHESGCFVIPNPWDLGSARILAGLGFQALATTSAGFAWSQGRTDNHVTLDLALTHLQTISHAVSV